MMLLDGSWGLTVTDEKGESYFLKAEVPGCVHTDLIREGVLENIFWRDNAKSAQWVERCSAVYRKGFYIRELRKGGVLRFEGLDTYASVTLNGVQLGETNDMFIPYEFPVDGILRTGMNVLEVSFRSPVIETEALPKREGAFTTERLYTRRIQCTYGWDWVDRFVTMGIWKSVSLDFPEPDLVSNVYVYTKEILDHYAQIAIEADFENITGSGWAEMEITDPSGKLRFSKKRKLLSEIKKDTALTVRESITIADPYLWFPAGSGEQPLYTLRVSAGKSEKTIRFGIRKAVVLQAEDEPGSMEAKLSEELKTYGHVKEWDRNDGSSGFTLYINDRKVFCAGANWVPCEPFPSNESPEKIERILRLAKEANVNMLRVWGGGIFEQDAFYNLCDELGILVTQDFLMACGDYPEEDDGFIELLGCEAKAAALRLRNHPCLVWWSGDNENAVNGDENSEHYNGRRAALEGIGPVLRKYDPQRLFLPSSPYGGVPYASATRGTTHNTQFLGNFFEWVRKGDFSGYRSYFEEYLSRFCAEQPALGLPFVSSLLKFMTEDDIFGENLSVSEFHTKNNPGLGDVTLFSYVNLMSQGIFGDYKNGKDRVRKQQLLQTEWIRISLELCRRNAWYNSGIIYWMWNDCWPAANGWSMIDYYCCPKPSYYAFKRAAASLIGSITEKNGEIEYCICDTGTLSESGDYRLYLYNISDGTERTIDQNRFVLNGRQQVLRFGPISAADVALNEKNVLILDIRTDSGRTDRAFFVPIRWADMDWPEPETEVIRENDDEIILEASSTYPALFIDVPYVLDRNGMFLKKGEKIKLQKERRLE